MVGRVVSTKMEKTVVVLIERKKTHPLYKKSYLRTKKYLADDSLGAKLGDIVVLEKIRPISKRKHWKVVKILGGDFVSLQEAQLKEGAKEAIAEAVPAGRQVLPEEKEEKVEEEKIESTTKVEPVEEKKTKRVSKAKVKKGDVKG